MAHVIKFSFACELAREASLNWNGEGSFLFTSSSAPYDCFDNGAINEVLNLINIILTVSCSD